MSDTKVIHSSDTSGHIFSLFLKYVSANVLGMIGFSCYILADTFFIARGIGSDALAALNLVLPAYSLLNGTGLMIGMGGGSRYSLSSTHPEGETHRTVFTQSVLLAVIAAIFFALTGLLGAEPLRDRTVTGDRRVLFRSAGHSLLPSPISVSCWHLPPYFWPITFSYALSEMTVNPLYPWQE